MGGVPRGKRAGERRMAERTLQIAPYARHVTQILRLAVAQVEPCEDAENLAGALGRERDVVLDELAVVEGGIGEPARADIAGGQRQFVLLGNVNARVLQ